jgi:hypothetical protein
VLTAPNRDELPDFSKANCRGNPVEWWHPSEKTTREQRINVRDAIAICRDCRIRSECLAYSLKWEPVGIWGGHTEQERHTMRKSKNISCNRGTGGVRTIKNWKGLDVAWEA